MEEAFAQGPAGCGTRCRRIPGARRHLVPGVGGALLWTHTGPILRTLFG
ncbi:hypothetical protein [Nonomuraea sp. NPDC050643]